MITITNSTITNLTINIKGKTMTDEQKNLILAAIAENGDLLVLTLSALDNKLVDIQADVQHIIDSGKAATPEQMSAIIGAIQGQRENIASLNLKINAVDVDPSFPPVPPVDPPTEPVTEPVPPSA
jgi:hypothetical protein